MGIQNKARFDYLLGSMLNGSDKEIQMELTPEEQEFFKSIDLTEVLFI